MDPTLPNPLVDLHHQKKQQKRQQFQQQQQFLYQNSAHFNDETSPPLPPLSHLMHSNNNSNKHRMPLNVATSSNQHPHLQSVSKVSYTNMNSSPIPTQMYNTASMSQQQQQQHHIEQQKAASELDNNSLTFYQRSVVDMYEQPSTTSPFYSNVDQDGNQRTDPAIATVTASISSAAAPVQSSMATEDQQKIYSFVPLDVIFQQKRPRKKFNEVERLYSCTYLNCTKAYGTLNHLNAHVTMQSHGPKRMPIEFKELRRQLKKNRKSLQSPKPRKASNTSQKQQQQQQLQQEQDAQIEADLLLNEQNDILPSDFFVAENHENNNLMMNQQTQQPQGFSLYGPPPTRSSSISSSFHPQQQQQQHRHHHHQQQQQQFHHTPSPSSSSQFPTRHPTYNMMQQQHHHQNQPFH